MRWMFICIYVLGNYLYFVVCCNCYEFLIFYYIHSFITVILLKDLNVSINLYGCLCMPIVSVFLFIILSILFRILFLFFFFFFIIVIVFARSYCLYDIIAVVNRN